MFPMNIVHDVAVLPQGGLNGQGDIGGQQGGFTAQQGGLVAIKVD